MPADLTLLRPGHLVRTWGGLVRDEEGDWFEPPGAVQLGGSLEPQPHRPGAVPVVGADFGSLADRTSAGRIVRGDATLTGRWTGHSVEVVSQSTERPPRPPLPHRVPPCPPPEGGWPPGTDEDVGCSFYDLWSSGAVVAQTRFHPSPTQVVLVVAAVDLAAAEARLRPQLGDRLCLVRSRATRAEIDAALARVSARFRDWGCFLSRDGHDDEGQLVIHVSLRWLLPEVVEWVVTTPPGLVALHPWLAPASGEQDPGPLT